MALSEQALDELKKDWVAGKISKKELKRALKESKRTVKARLRISNSAAMLRARAQAKQIEEEVQDVDFGE
jgi:hypothetical protein